MPHGWAGKILDVDLGSGEVPSQSKGEITSRDSMLYARDYIGGRILASRIAWDEIPADADPYDPDNRIIIVTGPLTGTLAPTAGRTVMASLSPRVYPRPWHTHSTLGGWFGPELKYAGWDAIVIHGRADTPVYLEIRDSRVRILDARHLWGLDTREVQLQLKATLGERTQVLTIGPAGENLVRFATVQHAEENAAGHSGFGAVWGSKNLKAIAVRGTGGVTVADPDALLREVTSARTFHKTPAIAVIFEGEDKLRLSEAQDDGHERPVRNGSDAAPTPLDEVGAAPKRHGPVCSQGCTFDCIVGSYEHTADDRLIPAFCIGGVWRDESFMQDTAYSGGGMEVPPGKNFGMCEEVTLHELCNTLGLDLWFRLVMQPWLIRCRQLGIDEIRGHRLEPENVVWFERFMRDLAARQGLGAIFAEDLRRAMDELEGELPDELIQLGHELEFHFGFPAHREGRFWDEEPLPFWVVSAMMHASTSRDPTIGTHQSYLINAEFFLAPSAADRELARQQFRHLADTVWGLPDAFEPTFENKAPVAIWAQHQHMLIDSLPLCDFAFPQLVRPMKTRTEWQSAQDIVGDLDMGRRLLTAVTGRQWSDADLMQVAERGFTLERALLARAGRGRALEETLAPHFELPCRADGTLIDTEGFGQLLDEYYDARGWDLELGWPQTQQLCALGLPDVACELGRLRESADSAAGPS